MGRYIILDENSKVIRVRNGWAPVDSEIESDIGDEGQIRQPDGTFITPEPEPVEPVPTLEEQVAQLKSDNLILMDALATTFEEILILEDKINALGGTPA